MTVAELARRSGVNRSTLSGYLNHGAGNIQRETVVLIARALEAPVGEALAAAGGLAWLIPERAAAAEPDPDLELILTAEVSHEERLRMIDRYSQRRREDLDRRLAEARYQAELAEIDRRYRERHAAEGEQDQRDVG